MTDITHLTPVPRSDERAPECVHHWILGEPFQGRIIGRCRKCGADRAYLATPESTDRFDDYRELTATSSYHERLTA